MQRIDQIAARVGDLPMLPGVASEVMQLVNNVDTNVQTLQMVISRDQALAARVLKLANSALFGLRGKVSTVSHAIVMLGFNTIYSVVMGASTESLFKKKGSRFEDKMLWEHANAVALTARFLAGQCRHPKIEEAFVAGLLHDLAKVTLDIKLPEQYGLVMQWVYNEGSTFVDAENEVLGFDHAQLGARILEQWGFSEALQEVVRLHHRPELAEIDPELCAIVSLANSICVKIGVGPERIPEMDLVSLPSTQTLDLEPDQLEEFVEKVQEALEGEI